jgi:hypothetical protein
MTLTARSEHNPLQFVFRPSAWRALRGLGFEDSRSILSLNIPGTLTKTEFAGCRANSPARRRHSRLREVVLICSGGQGRSKLPRIPFHGVGLHLGGFILLLDLVVLDVLIKPCRRIGLTSPTHFYMEYLRPAVSPHGSVPGDKSFRNRVCVIL